MKKSLALILGLCIFLSACTAGKPTETIGDPTTIPPTSSQTTATTATAETGGTDETVEPSKPDSTQSSDPSDPTESTRPAATIPGNKEDTDTPKQTEPKETEPPVNTSQPTTPPETQPEETVPPETQPATKPPQTEPNPTHPETNPTEPPTQPSTPSTEPPEIDPTEPPGCRHDWKTIHHAEEGHWRAGVVCDCGWTAYGAENELAAMWNAHSTSFPPSESIFEHGGYGCVDEWIVDKPAYDEWVCSHCGERKE